MAGTAKHGLPSRLSRHDRCPGRPRWVKYLIGTASLALLGLFLVVPLAAVFTEASEGAGRLPGEFPRA